VGRRESGPSLVAALHLSQPLFGFITEGVNLVDVVAAPPGKSEPLVVGLIRCEGGLPDPEERVANLLSVRVDLRRIVARPSGGG
jgi:hypothetical protein